MKKYRILILSFSLLLILALQLEGQIVEKAEAISISESFIKTYFEENHRTINDVSVHGTSEHPLIYIVNLIPEGWILVSGNKGASPVIGFDYSGKYKFPEENPRNPEYKWLMHSSEQLNELFINPAEEEHKEWTTRFSSVDIKSAKSISPLIEVEWGQGTGWNQFCPSSSEGPDGKALVGCVAVAMAQALTVFKEGESGTGTASYQHDFYGMIRNDFTESVYKWDSMAADTANQYSALLLYDCATAVDMDFGGDGSSAYTSDAADALSDHFRMSDNANYLARLDYGTVFWTNLIIKELEEGRPVIYRGHNDDGGHAFNIDGLVSDDYFHINWGWTGSQNSYFLIDNLNPGSRTYNEGQAAIFGIQGLSTGIFSDSYEDNYDDGYILYPNPTSDILKFSNLSHDRIETVRIYTITGRLLESMSGSSLSEGIDLSNQERGVYIIEAVLTDNSFIRKKVVRQ